MPTTRSNKKQFNAVRPTTAQVRGLRYAMSRLCLALKRRGLTIARPHEIEAYNALYTLFETVTGQQNLFQDNRSQKATPVK